MALFQPRAGRFADRRAYQRYTVDSPARLKLRSGERLGKLSDLSESGARFETERPPIEGTQAVLVWGNQQHACKVMWSSTERCGLHFERPIEPEIVAQAVRTIAGA